MQIAWIESKKNLQFDCIKINSIVEIALSTDNK